MAVIFVREKDHTKPRKMGRNYASNVFHYTRKIEEKDKMKV